MIPRFLLAQRAPAEGYPPVLHQAEILSSVGEVTILDSASSAVESRKLTSPEIRRARVDASPSRGGLSSHIAKVQAAWRFRRAFQSALESKPAAVIAFEPEAASQLLGVRPGRTCPLRIVHLHEHPTPDAYASSKLGRIARTRTLGRLGRADAVVVADPHRATLLMGMTSLEQPPLVVMNCPLLLNKVPESRILPQLRASGLRGPLIHYHGAVGPDHGLEITIRSMISWPADACFVIVGGGSPDYTASLRQLAASLQMSERVVFIGRVPYDEVFAFAAGATLGVTLLDTSKPNWRFAAGASNKRFEYMALGIPQVTSSGPGTEEIFEKPGVALLADATNPSDVARQINRFLASPPLRERASAAARKLHVSVYNYEHQYRPVLDRITERTSALRRAQSA